MNRMVKNASWIIACRIGQSALSFIVSLLTARYLGPANFGILNYATSLVAFATPIMTLGLNNTLVQDFIVSPEDEGEILGTTLVSSTVSSLFCMFGITMFALVANKGEKETVLVCALYSIILVFQALELSQYWFQAKLLSKYTSIVSLCAYVVVSAYKIILLATGKSVYWFAVSYAIDYMIISVGQIAFYKKLGGKKLRFSFSRLKSMFNRSRHYIIASVMIAVFTQTGTVMLKLLLDETATGIYSVAVTCTGITTFVFTAIIDSFRPVILQSKTESQEVFERKMKYLFSIIIALGLLQCIGITLFSKLIIGITYGVDYAASSGVLQIIVWQTLFAYIGNIRNVWILAEEKQKYLWIINFSGAVINVALNTLLIPVWGVMGAAVASMITQVSINVLMNYVVFPLKDFNRLLILSMNPKFFIEAVKTFKR